MGWHVGWFAGFKSGMRELRAEWRARRDGRRHVHNPISHATRDITGPTGWVWSNAWDEVDKSGDAYVQSFDRRLPPSTFVSERDRKRANQPMPVAERCIEDWGKPDRGLEPLPTLEQDDSADLHSD